MEGERNIIHYRKTILLLIFGICISSFVFFASSPSNLSGISSYDLEFKNPQVSVSWNTSDYINFTGPAIDSGSGLKWFRIFIDDNDPSRNWSKTALDKAWCTGSGTYLDPYIIENLYINPKGYGGMIFVKNSDNYFIIRNNWFDFSGPGEFDDGVLIQFTENGIVENNIFTYTRMGVNIGLGSHNNTVDNNVMISDHTTAGLGRGIQIGSLSNNNTITNNKIRNYYSGMGISSSNNNLIEGNYLENTIFGFDDHPILAFLINDTQIVRNVFAGAFASGTFEVMEIHGSSGNIIANNTVVTGEPWTFGPETSGTVNLDTPKLQQNGGGGIKLDNSHNNLVAHNIMLGESAGGSGEVIYGFDIFILLGMFGVISVLLAIVKRKRR